MTKQQIIDRFLKFQGDPSILDFLVYETASVEAMNINGRGFQSQIEYLLNKGIPEESILAELQRAL